MNRSEGRRERITPRRTLVVALSVFAAAVASILARGLAEWLSNLPQVIHPLWHLLWALLVLPIAFGLYRFHSASPATGWTERCLAAADLLVRVIAAGNFLGAAGAALIGSTRVFEWRLEYIVGLVLHNVGEVPAFVSLGILPLVILVMWVSEVRGAQRPTAHAYVPPAP